MSAPPSVSLDTYEPNKALVPDVNGTEVASAAVAARARAEVEARTLVAMKFPRDVNHFANRMLGACDRLGFADAAQYSIPRGGKQVTGLTIRFAEECARNYGNLDISAFLISETPTVRVLKATVVDLEVNLPWSTDVVIPKTVERRKPKDGDEVLGKRTNSEGHTVYLVAATDDEVQFKQNREMAKAIRNLILAHIPSDIREQCEEKIGETIAAMAGKDPEKFLAKIANGFKSVGVTPEQLDEYLGKSTISASVPEIQMLGRIFNAIKSGETTWKEALSERLGDRPAPAQAASGDVAKSPLARAVEKVEPAAAPRSTEIPPVIAVLLEYEKGGKKMKPEDAEELRQFKMDNPQLFPGDAQASVD